MSFAPSTITFLISVLLGVVFGAVWDCLRIIRKKVGDLKKLVFVFDLTFFILVSICTICFFFLFTYGGFRAFALIGEFLGFVLFYSIFEKPVFPLIYFIISIMFKVTYFIYKIFKFSFLKSVNFSEKLLITNLNNFNKNLRFRQKKTKRSFRSKNKFFKNLKLGKSKNGRRSKKE